MRITLSWAKKRTCDQFYPTLLKTMQVLILNLPDSKNNQSKAKSTCRTNGDSLFTTILAMYNTTLGLSFIILKNVYIREMMK